MARSIGQKKRFEVLKRDGFRCQYCGRGQDDCKLQVDHIIAVAKGGGNEMHNLITSCWDCNIGKGDRPIEMTAEPVESAIDAEVNRLDQLSAKQQALIEYQQQEDELVDAAAWYWLTAFIPVNELEENTLTPLAKSILRGYLRKLPPTQVREAIDIAHARIPVRGKRDGKTWKYFCGICRNKVKRYEGVLQ